MTNEEAMQILEDFLEYDADDGYLRREEVIAVAKVIADLRNQPRWIPCSEQMPPQQMVVIYSTKNNIVRAGTYEAGEWWDLDYQNALHGVIAWMPMPEPYGGGEAE